MIIKDWAEARALFQAKGLPVTHQRLVILRALQSSREHPSAETLYRTLKPSHPSLSLATVYKTLQALQDRGLIAQVHAPAGTARYDAITQLHHHLVCDRCGRIYDLFDRRLDAVAPRRTGGFKVASHSVYFRGVCARCQS